MRPTGRVTVAYTSRRRGVMMAVVIVMAIADGVLQPVSLFQLVCLVAEFLISVVIGDTPQVIDVRQLM